MSTTQQEQTRAAASQEYLLEMRGITKAFAGVQALKGVDFYVRPGTVHALMGENGAGKSTLMKCLFGIYHKDEGTIKLRGQEVNFQSPHEALLNGISMVHQELEQVPERSVMENVWLGRFPKKFGLIDTAKMVKDTEAVLATLGGEVKIDPRARLSSLTVSKRQMVDIAKAVSYNCDIIALDEPTSSLNEKEVDIAVVAVMWVIWNRTTLGKNMFAIGGNREAAKVCGVNVKRTIIIVYIIAGLLYAFGGVLEAGRTGSANSTMGADYAMDAIAACVVGGVSMKGGTGTLPGVVIGVIIFQIISYGLIYIGVSPDLQYVVKGLIIIVAVVLDNQKSLRKAA